MPNGDQIKLQTMRIDAFSGGINTSSPANEIEDSEAVDILNMEFDDADNLVSRNGVVGGEVTGFWDQTNWDESLWDFGITTHSKRITSILDFENASGFIGILYTTGTILNSRTLAGVVTNLTGSLVLPDDVRWYWKIFNGVAIGVNGLSAGDNPIQVVGPAPGTASKLTTAPPGKFIEVWNDRVWIARSDQPNQIQASDIGSHSAWNTDAGANPAHGALYDIDKNDGDEITGLYATKERLFIFKKRSIYVAFPERQDLPVTDLRGLKIEKYASNIGCIAGSTIRPVFDDVLFLSEGGVASLAAAQIVADFESVIISKKVADLQSIGKDTPDEDVFAFVIIDRSQYWLSVAAGSSPTGQNVTYVFDYRQLKRNIVRWVRFDKFAFGTSIEVFDHDVNDLIYLLGCHNSITNTFFIGQYTPKAPVKIFSDGSAGFSKSIITKAYDFSLVDLRKYFSEWFLGLLSLSNQASLSVSYIYDEGMITNGEYSFVFSVSIGGVFFDAATSIFDLSLFDQGTQLFSHFVRRSFLYNKFGRKARSVQFKILNSQSGQGFGIKSFGVKYQTLTEYRAATF